MLYSRESNSDQCDHFSSINCDCGGSERSDCKCLYPKRQSFAKNLYFSSGRQFYRANNNKIDQFGTEERRLLHLRLWRSSGQTVENKFWKDDQEFEMSILLSPFRICVACKRKNVDCTHRYI
eukprot:TRINITY_DN9549_c0_g1_i1.p3 TRINITY_DN9549_c0_g1~~TRINITY_DN9549_c0_g1_i1.p3  ORF type:complete len:122 (-),score=4.80 TRINITY_DN9549_c0_g1_i1:218-583(-)